MKKIFIISFVLAQQLNTFCQTAFYDAVKLKSLMIKVEINVANHDSAIYFDDKKIDEVYNILKSYTYNPVSKTFGETDKKIYSNFCNAANTNNFICKYFQAAPASPTKVSGNILSSIGNLNVTAFADGLAKFLVKRSKEELYISFFSKLQDSTNYPEFKILFPHTKVLVDNFKSWEYANIINTLKEAFDKDFKSLLADIPKLNSLDVSEEVCGKCNDKVKKRIIILKEFFATDAGRTLLSAFIIGNGFISDEKIPDMIHEVASNNYLGGFSSNDDIKNSIKLLDILSYSLKSNEYGKSYINIDTFHTVMGDAVTRNIYLGLIYQQLKNDSVKIGSTILTDILTPTNYSGFQTFLDNLLAATKDIDTAYKNLSAAKKKGETDLTTYWGGVFATANDFIQKSTNIQLINPSLKFPNKLQNVFNLSNQTLEIAHDIAVRNYSAVIVGVINFISQNTSKTDSLSNFKTFFVKYGSFAANVVEAKNSDDVEKAIESVALPVGSASIKKKTAFNIALNGYLGGFYGNEFLMASPGKKWATITGVYAPVGITASWGLGKCGSISAFGSIIDISAFASYRLKDDTTKALPEVSLKNILAPGLGVIYGLPGFPLSIGYTWQYGPMLREIKSTGISASDKPNHRWQFFLAVDIPIVNFYTKSK